MTKQIIKETLDVDWIDELEDKSLQEAVDWLKANIPEGWKLGREVDYNSVSGELYKTREETDEEYETRIRIAAEKAAKWAAGKEEREAEQRISKLKRLLAQEQELIKQKIILDRNVASLVVRDHALKAYFEKHKDNPRIADMVNLFTALGQMEIEGKHDSPTVEALKNCLVEIEKETP